MRYAYKVWHSEEHKNAAKRRAGHILEVDEVALAHESLEALVALNYKLEPKFTAVSVVVLRPSLRGVIVILDSALSEDDVDDSLARCLVRINRLDVDLCFVAEPLPVAAT